MARAQFEPLIRGVLILRPPRRIKRGTREAEDGQTLVGHLTAMSTRYSSELGYNDQRDAYLRYTCWKAAGVAGFAGSKWLQVCQASGVAPAPISLLHDLERNVAVGTPGGPYSLRAGPTASSSTRATRAARHQ